MIVSPHFLLSFYNVYFGNLWIPFRINCTINDTKLFIYINSKSDTSNSYQIELYKYDFAICIFPNKFLSFHILTCVSNTLSLFRTVTLIVDNPVLQNRLLRTDWFLHQMVCTNDFIFLLSVLIQFCNIFPNPNLCNIGTIQLVSTLSNTFS